MSSLTGMIQRKEWKAVISRIRKNPWEASVQQLHLHEACKYDPPMSVVSAFVRADSHFRTASDQNGELPIHTACYYGASEEVIKFLAYESLSVTSRVSSQTPLDVAQTTAWEYNRENQACIIRILQKQTFPALFDALTGLPTKTAFHEWAHVSPYAVCYAFVFFIDIVGFKYLNDNGGQNVGDEAIKMYASSIEKECSTFEAAWASEHATYSVTINVFRVGGDEFVVVIKSPADAEELLCQRIWREIYNTLLPNLGSLKESTYHTFVRVGCSAGTVSTPEHAEAIRKRAEVLQNELKAQLKTKRGEEPLLSDFHADCMSKVNICNRLSEWDPVLFQSECHQAVGQPIHNTAEQHIVYNHMTSAEDGAQLVVEASSEADLDTLCVGLDGHEFPVGRLPLPSRHVAADLPDDVPFVFLSHTGEEDVKAELARPTRWFLKEILKAAAFVDDGDAGWGQDGDETVAQPAYACTHAVVILSPTFRKRIYCVRKLNTFMHRWRQTKDNQQSNVFSVLLALWKGEKIDCYHSDVKNVIFVSQEDTHIPVYYMVQTLWPRLTAALGRPIMRELELKEHFVTYVDTHRAGRTSLPPDFLRFAEDMGAPPLVPTSDDDSSVASTPSSMESSMIVGISFSKVFLDNDRTWNAQVLARKEQIEDNLKMMANYGTVTYGQTTMMHKRSFLGRAVVRLECVIEYENLSGKRFHLVQQAAVAIAKLLRSAETSQEHLDQMMIGTAWKGCLQLLLEAPNAVFEKLISLLLESENRGVALDHGLVLTGITPAFVVRAKLINPPPIMGDQDSNVVLWDATDDACVLVPTSPLARGELLAGGVQYSQWQTTGDFCWSAMVAVSKFCPGSKHFSQNKVELEESFLEMKVALSSELASTETKEKEGNDNNGFAEEAAATAEREVEGADEEVRSTGESEAGACASMVAPNEATTRHVATEEKAEGVRGETGAVRKDVRLLSNRANVVREEQTEPKDIPQRPELRPTQKLEPTPDRKGGSETEQQEENDSIQVAQRRTNMNGRDSSSTFPEDEAVNLDTLIWRAAAAEDELKKIRLKAEKRTRNKFRKKSPSTGKKWQRSAEIDAIIFEQIGKVGRTLKSLELEKLETCTAVLGSAPYVGIVFEAFIPIMQAYSKSGKVESKIDALLERVSRWFTYLAEVVAFLDSSSSSDSSVGYTFRAIIRVLEKCMDQVCQILIERDGKWQLLERPWRASSHWEELSSVNDEMDTVLLERALVDTVKNASALASVNGELIALGQKLDKQLKDEDVAAVTKQLRAKEQELERSAGWEERINQKLSLEFKSVRQHIETKGDEIVSAISEQPQKHKETNSIIDLYFLFQPPPTIKDTYTSGVETEHISYLKSIKQQLIQNKKYYEDHWEMLKYSKLVISNGKGTTIENVLSRNTVRVIVWCSEGVDVNPSRCGERFIESIDSTEGPSMLPAVAVVILKYSPQRAAKELLSRGVGSVIWIRMDVYALYQEPRKALTMLFLPICNAILTGKDLGRLRTEFFNSLSDRDFGVEGAKVPQDVHYNRGGVVHELHVDLKGCEVCNTNILELVSRESFRELKVQSSDLQLLAQLNWDLFAAVRLQTQSQTKIFIHLTAPGDDGDENRLLARTRAIAWETCKNFTTQHSDQVDGVFRVSSISTSDLSSIERKLPIMDTLLLWVDLQSNESSSALTINPDSLRIFHEIGDQCRQLLVILTGDEKRLDVMEPMINGMGLKDVYREETLPEELPGTDMCASSMHDCICVIPTRKNDCGGDQRLLDLVLRDPAKFEHAFCRIVLSANTKIDDGADSPDKCGNHTNSPPIVAVYRDDNDQSIKVRVCLSDVIFMMHLCGSILSSDGTAKKLAEAINKDVDIRFDRSAFAEVFEKTLLRLEAMTPHQREKVNKVEGRRLVHIEAQAGTGKTFLALNLSLSFLREHKGKILLYASSSKALCLFFAKWLCKRPIISSKAREKLLMRLFLMYPGEHGEAKLVGVEYDENSRKLRSVERKIVMNKGGKVVVDEAHHVFDPKQTNTNLVASRINEIIRKNDFEVLILSDMSQSSVSVAYSKSLPTERSLITLRNLASFRNPKEKWCEVELTEVVRSCQRIVAGAMTYQLTPKNLTNCAHDIQGPPLVTYIFDLEKDQREEVQVYADKIVDAIRDLLEQKFQNTFDLHDRLAILVPDDTFRDKLKDVLEDKLCASLGQKFHLITALESSESLLLHEAGVSLLSPQMKCCIVLDSVSNFHGQERLIIFGVDLDRPIEKRSDVGLVRSQIYRTITRAQMMFHLINKSIKGGWFEWLQNMDSQDGAEFSFGEFAKCCNDGAADVVKRYVADDAALSSAVVARELQTGPKDISQLPERESTRELERTPDRVDGSEADPEQENDSIHTGAERSDEDDRIQNIGVWDTSRNDRILGTLSGNFVPIRKQVYTLRGHTDTVTCCAIFANGTTAISGSWDKTLKVWNVESGEVIRTLKGHTFAVKCCAVFADGTRAISGGEVDNTLKEWDLASGRELHRLKGHIGAVFCCHVFAAGTRAISGGGALFYGTLKVWDLERGRELRTLEGHTRAVLCCAVFADGTRAISGSEDKTLKVWDVESGEVIRTLRGHTNAVYCCAVFADGTRAISGSWDKTLKVWDIESGTAIQTLRGHTRWVNCCAVFADGTRAISGSRDRTLKVWDLTLR